MLLNYHIGRFVLGSLCVRDLVRLGLSGVCVAGFRCARGTIRTVHTTYAAALKTTNHPQTRCSKPYAATQRLMLLMMDVRTRNMSS